MNSAGLNPCLGGTGGLGAGLASPVSAGLASGFCAGAGAAGALRWATGGCDTVSGAFFAAFGSDETGFAARARSASTASAWARRSEASFCAGISWFSRGVTGVFTTLTWAVAASFSFNLETCAAFTRPLAGRAVGLRVEIGFTAFFSRVEAAARAAVLLPRAVRAGLRCFVLAPARLSVLADALRGMDAVRAFLALARALRLVLSTSRAAVLVLRAFLTFLTDDIRVALLLGSALETEHNGNRDISAATAPRSDWDATLPDKDHPWWRKT